jgi:hypothetical protein
MRHIIYARAKADIEISTPDENCCTYQKIRHPSYAPIRKLGAETLRLLTIWARQNLQLGGVRGGGGGQGGERTTLSLH